MKKYNLRQIFIPALMMMCLSLFPLKAFSEKEINISGKVEFLNPSFFDKYNCVWVKQGLSENSGSVDSVKVASDGTFSIKVKVPSEGFYQLDIVKWQTVTFWADDDINITCRGYDTAKIKVRNSGYININSNSAINNQINFFNYLNNQDQKVLNQLIAESSASLKYRNVDSTWYTYLRENNLYLEISKDIDKRTLMAINNTTEASVKLFLINQLDKEKYLDFMIKEVNNIVRKEPDFQDALAYKNILADYYESLSKTKIGNQMPDLEYLTNEGNPMKFSTLKGNYVIIDFCASWCGPCRK